MTPPSRYLLLAAGVASLADGCGGEPKTATTTLTSSVEGLTHVVAFTHRCVPVVRRSPPPGRYSVLVSVPGLCGRARSYVDRLSSDLADFDAQWNCIGEVRSGYCVDGAYTRGFSWDITPALSP